MNTRLTRAAALTAVLALALSGCAEPPPGTVVGRTRTAKDGTLWYRLRVRSDADRTTGSYTVGARTWSRCHRGDHYPDCLH